MNENRTHPAIQAIQGLMSEQGISKSELARRMGWGRMQVQRRLSGDAALTVTDLEEFAAVLGVPPARLLPTAPDSTVSAA